MNSNISIMEDSKKYPSLSEVNRLFGCNKKLIEKTSGTKFSGIEGFKNGLKKL